MNNAFNAKQDVEFGLLKGLKIKNNHFDVCDKKRWKNILTEQT